MGGVDWKEVGMLARHAGEFIRLKSKTTVQKRQTKVKHEGKKITCFHSSHSTKIAVHNVNAGVGEKHQLINEVTEE